MRPNTYDDTKAYCLCKVFVPPDGSDCRNKLLFSKCTASIRLLTQIHPSQAELNQTNRKRKLHVSSKLHNRITPVRNRAETSVNILHQRKECLHVLRQGMEAGNLPMCYFNETMEGGFFLFSSAADPDKYLGFNRGGSPFNYTSTKAQDSKCRRIYKRFVETSLNEPSATTSDYEQITSTSKRPASQNDAHRPPKTSTRKNHRAQNNKIEPSKARSTHSSTRDQKHTKTTVQTTTHHRHRHRHGHHRNNHTTRNKVVDSYDNTISAENLGNEDLNALSSHNDSIVNIDKPRHMTTTHARNHRKKTHVVSSGEQNLDETQDSPSRGEKNSNLPNQNVKNNELNNNNCTNNTENCVNDVHSTRGRKGGKGRNNTKKRKGERKQHGIETTMPRKSSRKSHTQPNERENT